MVRCPACVCRSRALPSARVQPARGELARPLQPALPRRHLPAAQLLHHEQGRGEPRRRSHLSPLPIQHEHQLDADRVSAPPAVRLSHYLSSFPAASARFELGGLIKSAAAQLTGSASNNRNPAKRPGDYGSLRLLKLSDCEIIPLVGSRRRRRCFHIAQFQYRFRMFASWGFRR